MPTYAIAVLKHQQRKSDNKFPVSIRITQNRKSAYIKTDFYVVKQQLNKAYKLKDTTIQRFVLEKIDEYEKLLINNLGNNISEYSAAELKDYIERRKNQATNIDFISFGRKVINKLCESGRKKRADHIKTVFNSLEDFIGKDYLNVRDLTSNFLREYDRYLRSERTLIRLNQFGREVKTVRKPLSDTGVHDYMIDINKIMNDLKDFYNDEDKGDIIIANNPFKKYKQPKPAIANKRNITLKAIKSIKELNIAGKCRMNFGRDVFMLSFYLVGANTIDLFKMEYSCLSNGRISYNRSKTEERRQDGALISIKIEPEIKALLEKYADPNKERMFCFYKMYSNSSCFNAAVNKGLKQVLKTINDEIEQNIQNIDDKQIKEELRNEKIENLMTYTARHSWATIARNQLNISIDDIALCLNHVSDTHRVTDGYIEKDSNRIDIANRRMIDLLNE